MDAEEPVERWQVEEDRARPGRPVAKDPDRPATHDPRDDLIRRDLRCTFPEVGEAALQ